MPRAEPLYFWRNSRRTICSNKKRRFTVPNGRSNPVRWTQKGPYGGCRTGPGARRVDGGSRISLKGLDSQGRERSPPTTTGGTQSEDHISALSRRCGNRGVRAGSGTCCLGERRADRTRFHHELREEAEQEDQEGE